MSMSYEKLFVRLKEEGMTTYTLRQKRIIGEKTLQALREGKPVRTDIICRLCYLFHCQPGDIMQYIREEADAPRVVDHGG